MIEAHEKRTLSQIAGAGIIHHIWCTVNCDDELYLRKVVLRMFWDGIGQPSVEVPLGDFFGLGHARTASYDSSVMNVSAMPGQDIRAAMNCYFPMPFQDGALIEVENQCEVPIRSLYYYIDYNQHDAISADLGRFHAQWRRSNPCPTPRGMAATAQPGEKSDVNLSDLHNYTILEAEGRGHYVGCNLSVHNLGGGWWGEGDDMFMIDGHKWPPDLHGTGSEDYFTHAWGMQPQNAFAYAGVSYHKGDTGTPGERITVYRHHIADPIIFHRSLRVSIEHGHANNRRDDYSSTAYWYQTLPPGPFPPLPSAEYRLPKLDIAVGQVD